MGEGVCRVMDSVRSRREMLTFRHLLAEGCLSVFASQPDLDLRSTGPHQFSIRMPDGRTCTAKLPNCARLRNS